MPNPLKLQERLRTAIKAGFPNVYKRWEEGGFQDNGVYDDEIQAGINDDVFLGINDEQLDLGDAPSLSDAPRRPPGTYRGSARIPWIWAALQAMVRSRQLMVSLTPYCEIKVINASAVYHGYKSIGEVQSAAYAAVQGEPQKDVRSAALSANFFSANTGVTSDGIATFGWRLRITASSLNFAYRPIFVDIGPVNNAAGTLTIPTPVVTIALFPRRLPLDVVVFNVANAAGYFTIRPGRSNNNVDAGVTSAFNGIGIRSLADANTFGVIESLNSRDLITRPAR